MTGANADRRASVLGSIRRSLGRGEVTPALRREVEQRVREPHRNLVPQRGQGEHVELVARFVQMAEAASCTVHLLRSDAEVPAAVSEYLRSQNLPTAVTVSPDAWLDGMDWASEPLLERHRGKPRNEDLAGLTPAYAAVAETGTLVLTSGNDHPATLNFMPDHHIVALRTSQVAGAYEDVWDRLRRDRGRGDGIDMPRTVNMITGPSRTGDIELTIYLGAHGPRSLHILLIDDEAEAGN